MVKLLTAKRPPLSLNLRNSTLSKNAMNYLSQCMVNNQFYLVALNLNFCYLEFEEMMALSDGIKFNKTIVKLDLSHNALKACVVKFFFDALDDNYCLAHLILAHNFLDNEFAVDLAHLLENNKSLHTVDITNNPIGPEGAEYLLKSLLAHNDTLESLGNLTDSNVLMGVRNREEIRQTLQLNVSNHERKRNIMNLIENTKHNAIKEKDVPKINDVAEDKKTKKSVGDDKTITMNMHLAYPLLKPIVFTNPIDDGYIHSGVWHIK